jgi:Ca-activated chloride channel family protein
MSLRIVMAAGLISLFAFCSCEKDGTGSNYSVNGYANTAMNGYVSVNPPGGNFTSITENPFIKTADSATSTFSIDADGASYATMRKWYGNNSFAQMKDGMRTEEFINYFTYNYPDASSDPISVNGEVSTCPWSASHKLIRIGIKGKSVSQPEYPLANFVLLLDVSGSMQDQDKLELLKAGFIDFVNQMRAQDRIAIVVYAGDAGVVLNSTSGTDKNTIISKLQSLKPGGSTNGAAGIKKAYEIALENFIPSGNNRVILGTDGDFNVGTTTTDELVSLIESKRDQGIFLTVLGVGYGNLNDGMMEKVANHGNGNYEYLDSKEELKKVFIDEYSKFLTVAKDVKVQVTFNPAIVEEYRLIGYENRVLKTNDFTDDKKDAGEIGAGQTITAIYEIKPKANPDFKSSPSFAINFRYKLPAGSASYPLSLDIYDQGHSFDQASENMRFAASLASLGLYLRNSDYKGTTNISEIRTWASGAMSFDPHGYRARHLQLLNRMK